MRQRLEKVTANHSVRSTKTAEKPALPREDGKVKRLEDNRKLLLEQQLGNYIFFCTLRSIEVPKLRIKIYIDIEKTKELFFLRWQMG